MQYNQYGMFQQPQVFGMQVCVCACVPVCVCACVCVRARVRAGCVRALRRRCTGRGVEGIER
jgi:hypothetical protein